jgi:hypothetical protein
MPRKRQPIKLDLRAARYDAAGNLTHRAVWIVVGTDEHGRRVNVSTGCSDDDVGGAQRFFDQWRAQQEADRREEIRDARASELLIADVLADYLQRKTVPVAGP